MLVVVVVTLLVALAAAWSAHRSGRVAGRRDALALIDGFGAAITAAAGVEGVARATATALAARTGSSAAVLVASGSGAVLLLAGDDEVDAGGTEAAARLAALARDRDDGLDDAVLAWAGFTTGIVEPLVAGGLRGAAAIGRTGDRPRSFDADDAQLLASLARRTEAALARAELVQELSSQLAEQLHAAHHDALTGLPNRVQLQAALDELLAGDDTGAVLLVDLDGFKQINDTMGHHTGDEVLRVVAARLHQVVGEAGFVTRLGGDEFAVVVPGAGDTESLALGARIRAALPEPIVLDGVRLEVGGSIGIAVTPPAAPGRPRARTALLKQADVALYAAKATAEGLARYHPRQERESRRRLSLTSALRDALARDELALHYQPQFDLRTGRVVGVEALLRWHQLPFGHVGPAELVDVAEHTGFIGEVTAWALRRATADLRALAERGYVLELAVNLSARDLPNPALVPTVEAALAASGFPPQRLTLELTETSMMTEVGPSTRTLATLAELGVVLSIDDFGTGYSSLDRLARLPVQEVKIDRGFVVEMIDDPAADAIVQATVDLARNLGLRVVAEGVETPEVVTMLRAYGCDRAQGFHFSPPMSLGQLSYWLEARPADAAGGPRPAHPSSRRHSSTPAS